MNTKLIWGGIAVAIVIAIGGYIFPQVQQVIGSVVGPDLYSFFNVNGVFQQGGGVYATSTVNTSETLLGSTLANVNVVDYTFNGAVAGGTVTLPASTTMPIGRLPGSTRTIFIRNATTTSGTTVTIAGNTGTLFKVASSTNQIGTGGGAQQIYGDTDGGNHARLDFVRKANSDIEVLFTAFRDN